MFGDERKHGKAARETAREVGEGGSSKEVKKRGTLYDHSNVKSTSLQNLKDSINVFRQGR